MHSAAECIRRPMHSAARPGWLGRGAGGVGPRRGARGRGGSHPGRAAECIGRRMHSAAECIQRPNAFRGSMHSEAVCIRRQYAIKAECNQGRMQSISLLPIAYCPRPCVHVSPSVSTSTSASACPRPPFVWWTSTSACPRPMWTLPAPPLGGWQKPRGPPHSTPSIRHPGQ